jgi:hypothetical protein
VPKASKALAAKALVAAKVAAKATKASKARDKKTRTHTSAGDATPRHLLSSLNAEGMNGSLARCPDLPKVL